MAEAFITVEAENFVTAHYEAKNRHLHNPEPRYNANNPKKGGSNLSLFKGNLAPASVSNPVSLVRTMADHFIVYLQQPDRSAAVHRVSSRYIVSHLLFPLKCSYSWIFHTVDTSPYSRYGAVIQKDSVEEYEH